MLRNDIADIRGFINLKHAYFGDGIAHGINCYCRKDGICIMGLNFVAGWLILFALFMVVIKLIQCGKQRKKTWLKIVGMICGIVVMLTILIDSGLFLRTGINSDRLRVIYSGTTSMGSYAIYEMKPHGIIEETNEIQHDNILSMNIKFGWDFKAIKSGKCHLLVSTYDGASLSDVYDYTVVVDDKLHMKYEVKEVELQ